MPVQSILLAVTILNFCGCCHSAVQSAFCLKSSDLQFILSICGHAWWTGRYCPHVDILVLRCRVVLRAQVPHAWTPRPPERRAWREARAPAAPRPPQTRTSPRHRSVSLPQLAPADSSAALYYACHLLATRDAAECSMRQALAGSELAGAH